MRPKKRQSLQEILQSTSDALFPDKLGEAIVTIESRDCDGDSPLHVLIWRGDNYGAKTLIQAGADVNAVGDMGETPLHVALRQDNLEIVELLVEFGASADIVSEFGRCARDLAAEKGGRVAKLLS